MLRIEVFNVLEYVGEDWQEYGLFEKPPVDAYEYLAVLFDESGDEINSFNSLDLLSLYPRQYLTKELAELYCAEIGEEWF